MDLQFPDGDIVLVIAERRYVVHKAVLGAHCNVFADMFTIPANPDQEIPVVQIHDEEVPFTLFLHALYGHKYLHHVFQSFSTINLQCLVSSRACQNLRGIM
jgi:hypothetical protein